MYCGSLASDGEIEAASNLNDDLPEYVTISVSRPRNAG
jgi:hypothetical protein